MPDDLHDLRSELARAIVRHVVQTDAVLATPGNPVARVRRAVLRGLREHGRV